MKLNVFDTTLFVEVVLIAIKNSYLNRFDSFSDSEKNKISIVVTIFIETIFVTMKS